MCTSVPVHVVTRLLISSQVQRRPCHRLFVPRRSQPHRWVPHRTVTRKRMSNQQVNYLENRSDDDDDGSCRDIRIQYAVASSSTSDGSHDSTQVRIRFSLDVSCLHSRFCFSVYLSFSVRSSGCCGSSDVLHCADCLTATNADLSSFSHSQVE